MTSRGFEKQNNEAKTRASDEDYKQRDRSLGAARRQMEIQSQATQFEVDSQDEDEDEDEDDRRSRSTLFVEPGRVHGDGKIYVSPSSRQQAASLHHASFIDDYGESLHSPRPQRVMFSNQHHQSRDQQARDPLLHRPAAQVTQSKIPPPPPPPPPPPLASSWHRLKHRASKDESNRAWPTNKSPVAKTTKNSGGGGSKFALELDLDYKLPDGGSGGFGSSLATTSSSSGVETMHKPSGSSLLSPLSPRQTPQAGKRAGGGFSWSGKMLRELISSPSSSTSAAASKAGAHSSRASHEHGQQLQRDSNRTNLQFVDNSNAGIGGDIRDSSLESNDDSLTTISNVVNPSKQQHRAPTTTFERHVPLEYGRNFAASNLAAAAESHGKKRGLQTTTTSAIINNDEHDSLTPIATDKTKINQSSEEGSKITTRRDHIVAQSPVSIGDEKYATPVKTRGPVARGESKGVVENQGNAAHSEKNIYQSPYRLPRSRSHSRASTIAISSNKPHYDSVVNIPTTSGAYISESSSTSQQKQQQQPIESTNYKSSRANKQSSSQATIDLLDEDSLSSGNNSDTDSCKQDSRRRDKIQDVEQEIYNKHQNLLGADLGQRSHSSLSSQFRRINQADSSRSNCLLNNYKSRKWLSRTGWLYPKSTTSSPENYNYQTTNNNNTSSSNFRQWRHQNYKRRARSLVGSLSQSSVFALYSSRYAREKLLLALRLFRNWYHEHLTYHRLSRRMEFNEHQFDHWFKRKGSPLQLRALDKFDQIVIWIADERDAIQTKTFSKWINKYLSRRGQSIHDLFRDLRDGQNLITLLEMLSGQQLPRERGRMRVHNLQNIQIALNYIRFRKVKLVNIRPEDIVDGNQKLTLGLIWTIILHFQLEDNSNFREILLRWAQKTCDGYPGTKVTDLTTSWRDGLAFNAILHRNRPDLLDYRACRKKTSRENLDQAFSVADRELGVARLLDPEDVDVPQPDEKSMITYLAQLYELFPDPPERNPLLDEEMIRRIDEYKDLAGRLVKWVRESTGKLDDRHFPRTIPELKKLRDDTERFRCEEVPPKQHDKQRLAKVAPEIADMAAELNIRIDNELQMPNIERLWDRMMAALKDRARAIDDEIAKAERLAALLSKLLADIKKTNERMDGIERDLNEEEKRVGRLQTLKEAEAYSPDKIQRLGEQLAEVGIKIDSIKRLADDFIKEAGRSHPDSIMIREKVADLDGRYKKLLAKLANIHDQYERTVKRLRELDGMRRDQMRKEAEAKLRLKLDAMKRELDELERRIDNMGPVSKDLATLQRQLAELHEFDQDLNRSRKNLNDLIKLAEGMIRDDLIADPPALRAELQALKDQLARIEDKAARRLREFEDALARAEQQKQAEDQINMKLDALKKMLDELERRLDSMAPVAKDLPTLKKQLVEMQEFQQDLARAGRELQDAALLAEDFISRDLIGDPHALRSTVKTLKDQFARIEDKAGKRLRAIEDALRHAEARRTAEQELSLRLDGLKKELDDLERRLDSMAPVAKDLATLKKQLAELQDFEHDLNRTRRNMSEVGKLADDLIRQDLISDPPALRAQLRNLKEQLTRIEDKFNRRMKSILDSLKRAEKQEAAEKQYRLRLDDMKRELDELERRLRSMAPIASELGPLREQLAEINDFLEKLGGTKKRLADLLKVGEELIRDDLIAEPQQLKADMKELKDQFDRIEEAAKKRLRDIQAAMSRVAASDAIQDVAQWLEQAKRVLVDEENVHGDLDTVTALIEQHKAFQAEVQARQPAIAEVRRREAELSSSSPSNGAQLRDELAALSNQWREMEKLTREKSSKLEEALRAAEQLHQSVHALLEWLAEAEMKLRFGGALPEDEALTRAEMAEHEKLLRKLTSQEQTMNQTLKLAQDILSKCHPDAEPVIKHWINIIQSRWDEIDAWAKQRSQRLSDHLRALEEIMAIVEELVNWLGRHETRLLGEETEPLPDNANQLDALIDQHSNFMDELRKREPQVDRVVKIFASKNAPTTSKVILTTTTTTSGGAGKREPSATRSGRLSAASGSRSTTPTRTSYATYRDEYPEVKQSRAKLMLEKWRQVWQLALDKMQKLKDRTEHLKEVERLENFDFDEWRRRFVTWVNAKKGRVNDFFRSIDDDNDGRIPIEAFVSGVLRSRFESSRLEMERVADIIDKNHDGSIDNREFLDALRPDQPISDNELIQDEVQRQVSKCTCSQRYKVYHVGDGRYRFGESQKLRLVRILRSTVMVRVGGGWEPLASFLQKNDPCRVKGRTNVELREQFILPEGASQAMAAFKTRLAKSPGSMSNLGPITKIREKTDRSMPMGPQTTTTTSSRHGSPSDYHSHDSHQHHSSQLPRSVQRQTQLTPTSNLSNSSSMSALYTGATGSPGGSSQRLYASQRSPSSVLSTSSRPSSRPGSDLSAEPSDAYNTHNRHIN